LTLNNGSPICHKEVLNSVSNNPEVQHDGSTSASGNLDKRQSKANLHSLKPRPTPNPSEHQESLTLLTETSIQKELDFNQDDIAIFKRVVQQIIHSDKPLSDLRDRAPDSPTVTESGASSAISGHDHVETREIEDLDYHPLIDEYLSKFKEKEILLERVDNAIERTAALEEEREARLRAGLALDPDDQDWLDALDPELDELAEKIQLLNSTLRGGFRALKSSLLEYGACG